MTILKKQWCNPHLPTQIIFLLLQFMRQKVYQSYYEVRNTLGATQFKLDVLKRGLPKKCVLKWPVILKNALQSKKLFFSMKLAIILSSPQILANSNEIYSLSACFPYYFVILK